MRDPDQQGEGDAFRVGDRARDVGAVQIRQGGDLVGFVQVLSVDGLGHFHGRPKRTGPTGGRQGGGSVVEGTHADVDKHTLGFTGGGQEIGLGTKPKTTQYNGRNFTNACNTIGDAFEWKEERRKKKKEKNTHDTHDIRHKINKMQ